MYLVRVLALPNWFTTLTWSHSTTWRTLVSRNSARTRTECCRCHLQGSRRWRRSFYLEHLLYNPTDSHSIPFLLREEHNFRWKLTFNAESRVPTNTTALRRPFCTSVICKSHSADGSMIETFDVSILVDQVTGMIASRSRYWNFPYPEAAIAVSKSASFCLSAFSSAPRFVTLSTVVKFIKQVDNESLELSDKLMNMFTNVFKIQHTFVTVILSHKLIRSNADSGLTVHWHPEADKNLPSVSAT